MPLTTVNPAMIGQTSTGAASLTATGSAAASLVTAAGTALSADSSGRITIPFQPAFTAYKNTGTTYSTTNTVIPLGDARVNTGNNFNTSTSRFTAPIAGRYVISAAGYGQTNPSVWEIRKNGARIQYIFLGLSDGGPVWMTHGASMVVSMNANDYIELFLTVGSVGDANDSTFLSGYLLG